MIEKTNPENESDSDYEETAVAKKGRKFSFRDELTWLRATGNVSEVDRPIAIDGLATDRCSRRHRKAGDGRIEKGGAKKDEKRNRGGEEVALGHDVDEEVPRHLPQLVVEHGHQAAVERGVRPHGGAGAAEQRQEALPVLEAVVGSAQQEAHEGELQLAQQLQRLQRVVAPQQRLQGVAVVQAAARDLGRRGARRVLLLGDDGEAHLRPVARLHAGQPGEPLPHVAARRVVPRLRRALLGARQLALGDHVAERAHAARQRTQPLGELAAQPVRERHPLPERRVGVRPQEGVEVTEAGPHAEHLLLALGGGEVQVLLLGVPGGEQEVTRPQRQEEARLGARLPPAAGGADGGEVEEVEAGGDHLHALEARPHLPALTVDAQLGAQRDAQQHQRGALLEQPQGHFRVHVHVRHKTIPGNTSWKFMVPGGGTGAE
ncbi:hypothetical protein EYF80_052134 [Liparis tanakae]|uniref:Uncharacterized protein n=1 Tax=Liparis tanakae TaxID=230148 RepID=A0A4Z2FBD7_9TELE|nr:hypothetical protein EYF80_052134 [Liparis tanakae]